MFYANKILKVEQCVYLVKNLRFYNQKKGCGVTGSVTLV
jgi:hypothetical protein